MSAVVAQIPGGTLDPIVSSQVRDAAADPAGHAEGGHDQAEGGQERRLLRDLDEADHAADPAGRSAGDDRVGLWRGQVGAARMGCCCTTRRRSRSRPMLDTPVRVKWINDLKDANGNYLPHLLPVDPDAALGQPARRHRRAATRGRLFSQPRPDAYTGPVPMVTHVHGAVGVGDESDGYAEAWYLPAATNIPAGYATEGHLVRLLRRQGRSQVMARRWGPGLRHLPVSEHAARLDHLVSRPHAGHDAAQRLCGAGGLLHHPRRAGRRRARCSIHRTGTVGGAARPGAQGRRQVPAEQDVLRDPDRHPGSLVQHRWLAVLSRLARVLRRDRRSPTSPNTDFSPIWNPEFFGNMIMVNGNTWPFQTVEQRRYRFRFLNGCDSRFLILDFSSIPGVEVWMIGNEGGFLAAPVNMTAANGNQLLMGPAERADVIVDFTNVPVGNYVLGNVGPDEPFGGGVPGDRLRCWPIPPRPARSCSSGSSRPLAPDPTTPPQFLLLPADRAAARRDRHPAAGADRKKMSMGFDDAAGRSGAGHGRWRSQCWLPADGGMDHKMWMDPVTENPAARRHRGLGVLQHHRRRPPDAHPRGGVRGREPPRIWSLDEERRGQFSRVQLSGLATPPEPWETGFKDTVIAYPGPGDPGQGAVRRRPASSSGTATSSSTRTTR